MTTEWKLFAIVGAFFLPIAIVYGLVTNWSEPVGPVGLGLLTCMMWMTAFYVRATGKRLGAVRPDDDPDGEIADAEGDYGFFAPHSWMPILLAFGAAMAFMGVAVGPWMIALSLPVVAIGLVGWVFEFFRGPNAV